MKREIKKNRMKRYFIDACYDIMSTEGMCEVTIRRVADLAGYNSATLYNYFMNLDHLMLYASCKYLKGYLVKLKETTLPEDSYERYLHIWRLFSEEAFLNPAHYHLLFFKFCYTNANDAIRDYFEIYSEELTGLSESLLPMLVEGTLWKRDYENLKQCAVDGYILKEDVLVINDMLVLIFQSMIVQAMQETDVDVDAYVRRIMDYITRILKGHRMDAS